ncbi:MAG: hypothetical protein V4737_10900, partial [Curtobacterium sp.]
RGVCPKRRAAEAEIVRESFDLPALSASGLDRDVASVLLDLLIRQPELALESLNEHARRSAGAERSTRVPELLVGLWRDYSKQHVLLVRSLERGETWTQLLACEALSGTSSRRRPRNAGPRSSQG